MSYNANFHLTCKPHDFFHCPLPDEELTEIDEVIRAYNPCGEWKNQSVKEDGFCEYFSWSCCREDCKELSAHFPGVLFTLTVEDGDFGYEDFWRGYFLCGAEQIVEAEIRYPECDTAKLVNAAIMENDRKLNTVRAV